MEMGRKKNMSRLCWAGAPTKLPHGYHRGHDQRGPAPPRTTPDPNMASDEFHGAMVHRGRFMGRTVWSGGWLVGAMVAILAGLQGPASHTNELVRGPLRVG